MNKALGSNRHFIDMQTLSLHIINRLLICYRVIMIFIESKYQFADVQTLKCAGNKRVSSESIVDPAEIIKKVKIA